MCGCGNSNNFCWIILIVIVLLALGNEFND